jgi:hypothetical protein
MVVFGHFARCSRWHGAFDSLGDRRGKRWEKGRLSQMGQRVTAEQAAERKDGSLDKDNIVLDLR